MTGSTTPTLELPTITVSGSREQMGRAHGLALSPEIRRFVPMRFAAFAEYASDQSDASVDDLLDAGARSFEIFRQWHPAGYREHVAVAEAAGVDAVQLFTAGNMTDMRDVVLLGTQRRARPDAEGCSAVLVPAAKSASGQHVCGQTWDLNPQDVDYVVAVRRKPDDALQTWSVSVCGCPSLVGMNEAGVTIGTTNVKTWGARAGVGYMNILHRMMEEKTASAAIAIAECAQRSGAHVYWACDADEGIEIEAAPTTSERRDLRDGAICRTNHCLAPANIDDEWDAPSNSSVARLARLTRAVEDGAVHVDDIVAMFADRSDGVDSVCRYEEDEQGTATDACIVAVPGERLLRACRGPADRGVWQTLAFD